MYHSKQYFFLNYFSHKFLDLITKGNSDISTSLNNNQKKFMYMK